MMSVDVESASGFRFGAAKALFQTKLLSLLAPARRFSVSPDGQRFLMNDPGEGAEARSDNGHPELGRALEEVKS